MPFPRRDTKVKKKELPKMLQVWIHIGHARDGRTIAGTGKSMWRHPPCLANWTRKWGLVSGQPHCPRVSFHLFVMLIS